MKLGDGGGVGGRGWPAGWAEGGAAGWARDQVLPCRRCLAAASCQSNLGLANLRFKLQASTRPCTSPTNGLYAAKEALKPRSGTPQYTTFHRDWDISNPMWAGVCVKVFIVLCMYGHHCVTLFWHNITLHIHWSVCHITSTLLTPIVLSSSKDNCVFTLIGRIIATLQNYPDKM